MSEDIKTLISQFESCMYASQGLLLRTGDVVELKLEEFQKIARHEGILGVFKEFSKDKQYTRNLWAVLNQPCDMVHDEKQRR